MNGSLQGQSAVDSDETCRTGGGELTELSGSSTHSALMTFKPDVKALLLDFGSLPEETTRRIGSRTKRFGHFERYRTSRMGCAQGNTIPPLTVGG